MRLAIFVLLAACTPKHAAAPWQVPDGWRHERIDFPLEFAPSLPHKGVEEIRFAPGFFDPKAPGYWSYAFVWRLDGQPAFDPDTVAGELTTYFRGLVAAVDEKIADRDSIVVHVAPALSLTAHVIDAFTTKQPVELEGTVKEIVCPTSTLWIFAIAPAGSPMRGEVDALASRATCDQPVVPNAPRKR